LATKWYNAGDRRLLVTTTRNRNKSGHPIFDTHTIDALEERLSRAASYLVKIRDGQVPARPDFRSQASAILGLPEEVLFLPVEPENSPKD
jgi:hypothetical protein